MIKDLYDEDFPSSAPIRVEQWRQAQAYAAALPEAAAERKGSFRERLGYPAPGFVDHPAVRLERIGEDRIATYHRCYIAATAQMETYGLYIVPKKARSPAPLVIAMHGGGGYPELATFQGGGNYRDLVRGPVAQGYVTFAPATVMHPYRDRDRGTPIPEDARLRLDARLIKCGTTLMGVDVTKIIRAIDVLVQRPEIDPSQVAMIGLSYGGFYTLYAAALDPRIRAAVASCSFRHLPPADPALAETAILGSMELTRLIAPRPLQIQAGIGDSLFPIDDVRRAVASGPAAFDYREFAGGHEWCGEIAWPFLKKHLL